MIFRFGRYVIDGERRELTCDGKEIMLQPQAFSLLVYLAEHSGRVVSKDELFEKVWRGKIVGDSTLNSRINALRRALGDDGNSQKFIKTLPRQGYRFVADTEITNPEKHAPEAAESEVPQRPGLETSPQLNTESRPTLAVLPFENMSGDPEQEYFADGIAEDILTALGRFGGFNVVARSSSFSFKGQAVEVRQIGKELRARYIVDGSVRKAGNRVRVSAELVDTTTGQQLFSEQYDRLLTDIFLVQDEITQQVALAIVPTIEKAEIRRISAKAPNGLAAWETCLQASALIYRMKFQEILEARRLFSKAIELDPDYARAHVGEALSYSVGLRFFDEPDRETGRRNFMAAASRAVELDPEDPKARILKALAHMYGSPSRSELAIKEAREATRLNPHDPQAYSVLGVAHALASDQIEEGIGWIEHAVRTGARDPLYHLYLSQFAIAQLCADRYEDAANTAQEAVRQKDGFIESHIALASAHGYLGKGDEADAALAQFSNDPIAFVENHIVFSEKVKGKVIGGLEILSQQRSASHALE